MKVIAKFKLTLVAGLATALLAGTLGSVAQAGADPADALNVAFGGSLVGTTNYTTQGSEVMRGTLHRVQGSEEEVPGQGVKLGGGTQGLRFDAAALSLGSDRIDRSFLMEVDFTPAAGSQTSQAPIMSTAGNFSVRYQNDKLSWGWDTNGSGSWTRHSKEIAAPTANKRHQFSIRYRVQADKSVVLDAMLDGDKLTAATGPSAANIAGGTAAAFGFGNEVHPQGLNRGFLGTIHRVRVAETAADGSGAFEFQPLPLTTDLLKSSWDGSLGDSYAAAGGEVNLGTVARKGSASVAGGKLTLLGGTAGVVFAPTENKLAEVQVTGQAFVLETKFTPTGTQPNLATIMSLGGNFFVRYQNSKLRFGWSGTPLGQTSPWTNVIKEVDLPAVNQEHTVSVAYQPLANNAGAKLTIWLDGLNLGDLTGAVAIRQEATVAGQAGFGNDVHPAGLTRGFVGSMSDSRFALLNRAFTDSAFVLQTLAEVCDDISGLKPANYQEVSPSDCRANILAKAALVRPTTNQANWQEEGLTAFIHYGINTYTKNADGSLGIEWGYGRVSPTLFDPTQELDADTWVKTLRDQGYRTALLVAKHHDGFMSWPTRYSDYSVKSSPWQGGKGDIVRDFMAATKKYGMKAGIYLSPADSHSENIGVHGNGSARSERKIPTLVPDDDRTGKIPADRVFTYQATDYGAFFLNTLYEVLTQYGEVSEVWFDGASGNTAKPEIYDYDAYYDLIHKLQPNANIAVGGRDIRWIGNEHGTARNNEISPLPIRDAAPHLGKIDLVQPGGPFNENLGSDDQVIAAVKTGGANRLHWWPAEADMKLTGGWFAHANSAGVSTDSPKSPSALLGHYFNTTGRNSVMLLNVPPQVTGKFQPQAVDSITGFASERRKAFADDWALGREAQIGAETTKKLTDGNTRAGVAFPKEARTPIVIDLGQERRLTSVGLSEDIVHAGMSVQGFKVEAEVNGAWQPVAESGTVGALRLVKFAAPVMTSKVRILVTAARADYTLSSIQLFGAADLDPGKPSVVYLDCSAERAGTGTAERPLNSIEQFRKLELAVGATIQVKAGTSCADADLTFWGYGTADAPIKVLTWGTGAAPTIGGKSLTERFAGYAVQGWQVPTATATPTVEPTPTATATATVTATPTPAPTVEPTPTATPTATSTPTAEPTATATATATPTVEPTSTPTPTVAPTATPIPPPAATGVVTGRVYQDLNGSGAPDPDEPDISGVTVELLDAQGSVLATTVTHSPYRFTNLPDGEYRVRVAAKNPALDCFQATSSTVVSANLAGSPVTANFAYLANPAAGTGCAKVVPGKALPKTGFDVGLGGILASLLVLGLGGAVLARRR